ncbi:MAG: protease inhibitor I42 family protein [Candidatus Competibacter phosphatis]
MPLAPESRLFPLARLTSALLALAALLVVGCASKPDSESNAGSRENGVLVLTRDDDQRTAEVRVGEQIRVRLPEKHGTGYVWAIDETDRQRLALDSTGFEEPTEGFIGARGMRTFTFTARQPGEVVLKLKHWRIWEGEGSVTERFIVTLRIQEK